MVYEGGAEEERGEEEEERGEEREEGEGERRLMRHTHHIAPSSSER